MGFEMRNNTWDMRWELGLRNLHLHENNYLKSKEKKSARLIGHYLISVRLLRLWAIQTSTLYINAAIGNEAANKPATVSGMTRGLLPHPMIRGTTVGRLAGS